VIDPGVAIGAAVALGGVGLGAWLTGRLQRDLLKQTHRREDRRAREDAYVAVLVAFRTFRVFLTAEAPIVRLGAVSPSGKRVPLIEGGTAYLDAVQEALARLQVLEGDDTPVVRAAVQLERSFLDLAIARANHPPGDMSDPELLAVRAAESAYARTAHQQLQRFDALPK
jgi:hypothetical protein